MECCYDPRVDICLLFVSGEGLTAQDNKLVQALAGLVPVVPVIAKVEIPGLHRAQSSVLLDVKDTHASQCISAGHRDSFAICTTPAAADRHCRDFAADVVDPVPYTAALPHVQIRCLGFLPYITARNPPSCDAASPCSAFCSGPALQALNDLPEPEHTGKAYLVTSIPPNGSKGACKDAAQCRVCLTTPVLQSYGHDFYLLMSRRMPWTTWTCPALGKGWLPSCEGRWPTHRPPCFAQSMLQQQVRHPQWYLQAVL